MLLLVSKPCAAINESLQTKPDCLDTVYLVLKVGSMSTELHVLHPVLGQSMRSFLSGLLQASLLVLIKSSKDSGD